MELILNKLTNINVNVLQVGDWLIDWVIRLIICQLIYLQNIETIQMKTMDYIDG